MTLESLDNLKKWPKIFANKYFVTIALFLVWMSYFDNNNLNRQYNLYSEKKTLERTVSEKKREIEMIKRSLNMLKDNESLERFAREEYRFKKPGEDVFVIVADE